jgi:GntR family transcriptional regulator
MNIILNFNGKKALYLQIYDQIVSQILTGTLANGDTLPGIRDFAAKLKVSAITTKQAYDELAKEGYVITIPGKGTFVADLSIEEKESKKQNILKNTMNQTIDYLQLFGIDKAKLAEYLK